MLPDDLIELGHEPRPPRPGLAPLRRVVRRVPQPVWVAMGVVAVALAFVLGGRHQARTPVAAPAPSASPQAASRGTTDLARVLAAAKLTVPLTSYVRQSSTKGACTLVDVGHSPLPRVSSVVSHGLPGYTVLDSAETLDQFTALCSLVVRATDSRGTVALVTVTSPGRADSSGLLQQWVTSAQEYDAGTLTSYVSASSVRGWTVEVGTTGPSEDAPSTGDLLRLAQDKRLTW